MDIIATIVSIAAGFVAVYLVIGIAIARFFSSDAFHTFWRPSSMKIIALDVLVLPGAFAMLFLFELIGKSED